MTIDKDLDGWWLEIEIDNYHKGYKGNKWGDNPCPDEPEECDYYVAITDGKNKIRMSDMDAEMLGYSHDTVLELYRGRSHADEVSRLADQAENRRDMLLEERR